MDHSGRAGKVCRCVAAMHGGAISFAVDSASATAAGCDDGLAGCPCGRRGKGSPKGGTKAPCGNYSNIPEVVTLFGGCPAKG